MTSIKDFSYVLLFNCAMVSTLHFRVVALINVLIFHYEIPLYYRRSFKPWEQLL